MWRLFAVSVGIALCRSAAPKELAIEQARVVAREMADEMATEAAKEAFSRFAASAKASDGTAAKTGSAAFVKSLLVPIERFTKPVRERHGLEGSFDEDMLAIKKAAQIAKDHLLLAVVDDLGEYLTGEPNPRREGRVPQLDAIAEEYIDMEKIDRKEALQKARAFIKNQTDLHESAQLYISTMEAIDELGSDFVTSQMPNIFMADPAPEGKQIMLNILGQFLRPQDKKTVQASIRELMEAKKKEEAKAKEEASKMPEDAEDDGIEKVEL